MSTLGEKHVNPAFVISVFHFLWCILKKSQRDVLCLIMRINTGLRGVQKPIERLSVVFRDLIATNKMDRMEHYLRKQLGGSVAAIP